MLVLSRKRQEWIEIGPSIRVCVVEIEKGRVRLGIEAPKDMPIWRSELKDTTGPASVEGDGAGAGR